MSFQLVPTDQPGQVDAVWMPVFSRGDFLPTEDDFLEALIEAADRGNRISEFDLAISTLYGVRVVIRNEHADS